MLESMLPMSSFLDFELFNGADARKVGKKEQGGKSANLRKRFSQIWK